ncbi:hypothetical protein C2869_12870 [Saccharobesus litoralis]|uniref:Uncharacterized protein n=1 Tax=Saccharobesus litoralis TaxID=2172099 RepID=A0A2S0VSV0_9ALTE|nr:hypothetical protein [Saccharobesus litoralis]AWB67277.1 hypothetical protein C2869_12870 [Saccharobesus litoralis]
MLFKINNENGLKKLKAVKSENIPELDLEKLLLSNQEQGNEINGYISPLLNEGIFGEELILLKNQIKVANAKRADLLALDRNGNGVIIELKKELSGLGVDTQALQYLASIARFKGDKFINNKKLINPQFSDDIQSYIDSAEISVDQINTKSRVILVAHKFDRTLFSMGEWLSEKGVAFKCIQYAVFQDSNNQPYIDFSVVFDRSSESTFPLEFSALNREPKYHWYNIGTTVPTKWRFLKENSFVSAGFDGQEGDKGTQLLESFVKDDILIAYVNGFGAVGVAKVAKADAGGYQLLKGPKEGDPISEDHWHRLEVKWLYVADDNFSNSVKPAEFKQEFDLHHPYTTSCSIADDKAKKLIQLLQLRLERV